MIGAKIKTHISQYHAIIGRVSGNTGVRNNLIFIKRVYVAQSCAVSRRHKISLYVAVQVCTLMQSS